MLSHFHLPRYFTNDIRKEIGELYAASAIGNLATSMVMIFEPIFLYAVLGFTIEKVLAFMAVVYIVYIFCIPFGGRMASIYGYKHAIAMSVPFQIMYWFLLTMGQNNHAIVFLGAAAWGLQKTFYWPGFHSLMARYANQQQMGREFGLVHAITNLTLIFGPFVGGGLSQAYGFSGAFIVASMVYCCSVIPLFRAKEVFVPKVYTYNQTWELFKAYPKKALGYAGFGEELLSLTVWPIFMYLMVGNFLGTGVMATVSSLVAAALALFIGKITDQYTKKILIKLGAFFLFLASFGRVVVNNVWNTFTADALSRTSKELNFVPLTTYAYLKAGETHVVPYVVFFEQSLAIGKLSACLIGIILFSLTGSFVVLFILTALYSLLYMYI